MQQFAKGGTISPGTTMTMAQDCGHGVRGVFAPRAPTEPEV